jgi:hypothetical protein
MNESFRNKAYLPKQERDEEMSTSVVSFTSFSNKSSHHKLADTYYGACLSVDGFKKLNRVGEGTYGIVSSEFFHKHNQRISLLSFTNFYTTGSILTDFILYYQRYTEQKRPKTIS